MNALDRCPKLESACENHYSILSKMLEYWSPVDNDLVFDEEGLSDWIFTSAANGGILLSDQQLDEAMTVERNLFLSLKRISLTVFTRKKTIVLKKAVNGILIRRECRAPVITFFYVLSEINKFIGAEPLTITLDETDTEATTEEYDVPALTVDTF